MRSTIPLIKLVVSFFLVLGIVAATYAQSSEDLVDIRPPELIEMEDNNTTGISEGALKAKELLHQCLKAHGWDKGSTSIIAATYVDDWSVAPEPLRVYNNWPDLRQEVQHDFLSYQLGYSRVQLLNGPSKDEFWGIDNNVPYKIVDGKINTIDDPNMSPALVGKEYFIQLPYWIKHVPITTYVKDTVVNNKKYHLVFGTWKTREPNTGFDQYLYWINAKTKLLEIVQYTVRVVDPKAVGFVVFDDFRTVDGVVMPFVHRLGYLPTPEGVIHEMRFQSIVFDPKEVSVDDIRTLQEKDN